MKKLILILFLLILSIGVVSAQECEVDDGEYYTELNIAEKTISVYKTDSNIGLCHYENFCESKGMNWYAPNSGSEADTILTAVRALDNYHTWILSKANTVLQSGDSPGTWNGQALTTVDSPACVDGSSEGFSAIRDWGCSMCDPEQYGVTKCWDNGHQYDWILCEGDYNGGDNEVPEFGVIGLIALGLAVGGFLIYKRR